MNTPSDTARLFIALWPGNDVRGQLREWRDAWTWPPSASLVHTGRLHMTLHFLGSVPRERIAELIQGLAVGFEPFELDLGHPELWPGGIAVLAPDIIPPPLLEMHGALGEALLRLGLALETRTYRPHVTLARRAAGAIQPLQGPPIRWPIEGYALMESKIDASGSYSLLQTYA